MKRIGVSLIIIAALFVLTTTALWAAHRTGPGAYLKYQASTVNELVAQVSSDKQTRMRYARHFKISPDSVAERFRSELQLITLKKPLRIENWYIDKNGKDRVTYKVLQRGALVFAARNGQPVMVWACGNPIGSSLPKKKVVKATAPEVAVAAAPAVETPVATKVLAAPIETITAATINAMPLAVTEAVAVEPVVALSPAAIQSLAPLAPSLGSRSFPFALLAPLGLLRPHNNPTPPPTPPTPPVPEPSSLIPVTMGLSTLALAKIRKRPSV